MTRIFRYGLLTFLALVAIFAIWLAHFIRPQTEYADMGMCSAQQIDKTVMAIASMNGWQAAATIRLHNEAEVKRFRPYSLNSHLDWYVNAMVYQHYAKRHTGAFMCNRAYVRFSDSPPVRSLPAVAERLRTVAKKDDEAWALATCLSLADGFSPVYPDGIAVDERLGRYCEMRKAVRAQRH